MRGKVSGDNGEPFTGNNSELGYILKLRYTMDDGLFGVRFSIRCKILCPHLVKSIKTPFNIVIKQRKYDRLYHILLHRNNFQ